MSPEAPLPWRSEVPLTEAAVRAVVDAQFPALAPARAVPLGDGWDCEAWLVNEAWAFKFPRRAAVEAWQDVERAALPHVAARVPLPVPVPVLLGGRTEATPFRFHGCRYLPGVPADLAPPDALDERAAAAALGRFVAALHGVPLEEARAWGVPAGPPLVPLSARALERGRWAAVRPAAPEALRPRVEAWLDAGDPPLPPGAPRLTHGDLRDGNLLLDERGRVPTGVIDWIDLSIADPARDFGGLLAWRGEAFLRAVLAHAAIALDDATLARSRRRAAHLALAVAWQGVLAQRPALSASGFRGLDHSL